MRRVSQGALLIFLFSVMDSMYTGRSIKKTQKIPSKEIAKAEALRKEYFNDKHKY